MVNTIGSVGLGCWAFGSGYWKNQPLGKSRGTIQKALDWGVTHFDTAQAYGNGISEQIVGQQLRKQRETLTIASKSFIPDTNNMERQIEKSLRRMCLDYLDLYYLHWPRREGYDLRPAMESMERARERGLIKGVGVSNFSPEQMNQVLTVGTIDALQLCYSPLWSRESTYGVPFCKSHSIPTVGYSILAQGVMTGKFTTPPTDQRENLVYCSKEMWNHTEKLLVRWKAIAQELNISMTALTVSWCKQKQEIGTLLLGARNREQLEEQLIGVSFTIPEKQCNALNTLVNEIALNIPNGVTNQFNHRVV